MFAFCLIGLLVKDRFGDRISQKLYDQEFTVFTALPSR